MAVAGSQGVLGKGEGDALLAAREKANLIGKQIVLTEMSTPSPVLKHAGKRREHVAWMARTCFAFSALMLIESIVTMHFSLSELARPLHWSEVLQLSSIPLHGAVLTLVALAHRHCVRHHGGRWLRRGRASYRAWRELEITLALFFAPLLVFRLPTLTGEFSSSWLSVSYGVAVLLVGSAMTALFFVVLRERLLPRSKSRRPWLRSA